MSRSRLNTVFVFSLSVVSALVVLSGCTHSPSSIHSSATPESPKSTEAAEVTPPVPDAVTPVRRNIASTIQCPRYTVYYIDPTTQFFTPPVPVEDHAEFVFCTEHENLDEIRVKLKKLKPVRSQADLDSARIKVIPRGRSEDALTFCSTGEITYRGKQYRLDRRAFEPSLMSIREEGDRQRAMAIEKESEALDSREPASPR